MGRALLKITPEMLNEIKRGRKRMEFRKLNKDYIQEGDTITFLALDRSEYLHATVERKTYFIPHVARHMMQTGAHYGHKKTADFIDKFYMDELVLCAFDIRPKEKGV